MPPSAPGAIRRQTAARRRPSAVLPGIDLEHVSGAIVLRFGTPSPGEWNNAFTTAVAGLLSHCRADARASTVVLTGPRLFEDTAGQADITPLLAAIAAPGHFVVAAIPGNAMGTGLELALACHARTATPAGRLGFPGILRGTLPLNGGIARLARLLAPEAALEMLAFGTPLPAPLAQRLGLLDAVAMDPVGIALLAQPAPAGPPPHLDPRPLHAILRRRAPGEAAPQAALQSLTQALSQPPQRALAEAKHLAATLTASPQGLALRHATLAEATPPPGTAAPALRWALLREAIHLMDEGATPQAVDLALRRFGFRTPPLAAADQDGLDHVAQACVDPRPDAWHQYSPLLDLLLDAGRTGRAAGAGWYRYAPADPRPLPDPALAPLLAESARAACRRRRPVEEAEITARCIAALASEAARLIDQGLAPLAADALSLQLGFPRWRGGIWHHVQATGPATIAAQLATMPTAPPSPLSA